jgi:hypothetical protein
MSAPMPNKLAAVTVSDSSTTTAFQAYNSAAKDMTSFAERYEPSSIGLTTISSS